MVSSIKSKIKKELPGLFGVLSKAKGAVVEILVASQKKKLPGKIESFYKNDPEAKEVIDFLKSRTIDMVPYFFVDKYHGISIVIHQDVEGFPYVNIQGNDIYYPKGTSKEVIQLSVENALIEQDDSSPHRYLPHGKMEIGGKVAVLCGASDCVYTLSIIDKFDKLYLFEPDSKWAVSMKKTLRKYLDKVEIVPYFISDVNTASSITLDTFLQSKQVNEINYLQADIEGDEFKMLRGAHNTLQRSNNLKLSVCCYHTPGQEKEVSDELIRCGFKTTPSNGFLLLWMQYPLEAPYLRRGVIYAAKGSLGV